MADLTMYGYTYEQWMNPDRLRAKAQLEWDQFQEAQALFDRVANKTHWKGPIEAVIHAKDADLARRAIGDRVGYRGLKFTDIGGGYVRVTSPGYWANGF